MGKVVSEKGFEPSPIASPVFETGASADSATQTNLTVYLKRYSFLLG